uniref:C2H2-type domain-containing protein n=1 Tax=Strongyloides venezuelensis TaxID=75913 RepID=A0A0K0EUY1_STRVS
MGKRCVVTEISPLTVFSCTFTVHQEQMNLIDFKNVLLNIRFNKKDESDNVKYTCPMPNCDKLFLLKEELQFHIECRHKSVDENDLFCTEVPDMFEDGEEVLPTFEKMSNRKIKRFTRLQEVAIQLYGELDMERRCFISRRKFVPFESGCLKVVKRNGDDYLKQSKENKNPQTIPSKRKITETICSDLLASFQNRKPKCSKLGDISKPKDSLHFNIESILKTNKYWKKIIKHQYSNEMYSSNTIDLVDLTSSKNTLPDLCLVNTSNDVCKNFCDIKTDSGDKKEKLEKSNIKKFDMMEIGNLLENEVDINKLFGMNVKLSKNYCDKVFEIASNFILKLSTSPEKIFNPNDNFRIII